MLNAGDFYDAKCECLYQNSHVHPAENFEQADFGVVLPQLSLLATIAFAYSVISPIINGLALLSTFDILLKRIYRSQFIRRFLSLLLCLEVL